MILERLEQRFALLKWQAQDLPARQHTLRAAIGWSYDLLSAEEQRLFRQLGVVVGGFDLEAAEAIVAGRAGRALDVLQDLGSLVDQSLVQMEGQAEERVRHTFLESIREYACEQLDRHGEREAAERAHAHYFLELAERADPQLRMRDQRTWTFRLEQEHDNLRVAFRWLLAHDEQETALHLAAVLGHFWVARGYHVEGLRWLQEALSRAPDADPAIRARALLSAGEILTYEGDVDRSRVMLEEALRLAQQRQDRSAIAHALTYLGARAAFAGDWAQGTRLLQEALRHWEELGDRFQIGFALGNLGTASFIQGDYKQAASLYSDAVARLDTIGAVRTAGVSRLCLGLALLQLGDPARAVQLVQEGLQVGITLRDRWHLSTGVNTALLLIDGRAEPEQRARLLGAGDALCQAMGITHTAWERMSGQSMASLREQLEQEGWGAAYRQGRSLSFEDVATLTLALLDDFAQTFAHLKTAEEHQPQESLLSKRELEVLRLVAAGLTSKAIGRHLFIAPAPSTTTCPPSSTSWASRDAPRRWRWLRGTASCRLGAPDERIVFTDLGSQARSQSPEQVLADVSARVEREEPDLVVIDSFKALHDLLGDAASSRTFVYDLAVSMAAWGATTLLVGEYTRQDLASAPEFAIADGIIRLGTQPQERATARVLEVLKLRGANYVSGQHFFEITGAGVAVYPRVHVPAVTGEAPSPIGERLTSGIAGLDDLLRGGVPRRSSTVVQGSTGSGKTLLGLSFLRAGAQQGERGLVLALEEAPAQLRGHATALGWDLAALEAEGRVTVLYISPLELSADRFLHEARERVHTAGAQRVVLDSISSVALGVPSERRLRQFIYALTKHFRLAGVTTLLTLEVPEQFGVVQLTGHGVSSIADNVVVLRFVEVDGRLERAISVLKARGVQHDSEPRRFIIGEGGLRVEGAFAGYRGILTGMPMPVTENPPWAGRRKEGR